LIIRVLAQNRLKCRIFAFLSAGEVSFENQRIFKHYFVNIFGIKKRTLLWLNGKNIGDRLYFDKLFLTTEDTELYSAGNICPQSRCLRHQEDTEITRILEAMR